jgi:ferredoxin
MSQLPQEIAEQIKAWLDADEIELFIGYEAGPVGLQATPAFVQTADDVDRLIWDATCENNLVAFLKHYKGRKVGLMVKGCDSRAIIGLLQENQVERENLRIVGVTCPGVIDPRRVAAAFDRPLEDMDEARLEGDEVVLEDQRLPLDEAIFALCEACHRHHPIVADIEMGAELPPDDTEAESFDHVVEMAALSDDERWARFAGELERCTLCYACRNACPMCYCKVCFADRTMPRWFNQTTRPEDLQFYQIMRTFHLAGRCVGCGACTRACPQGINLRLFLDRLRLDVRELYQYEAGVDPEAEPPLRTYSEDDYNDFVL